MATVLWREQQSFRKNNKINNYKICKKKDADVSLIHTSAIILIALKWQLLSDKILCLTSIAEQEYANIRLSFNSFLLRNGYRRLRIGRNSRGVLKNRCSKICGQNPWAKSAKNYS